MIEEVIDIVHSQLQKVSSGASLWGVRGVRGVPHPAGLRGCRQFLEVCAFVGKSRNLLFS